jgi:hypothetical protein
MGVKPSFFALLARMWGQTGVEPSFFVLLAWKDADQHFFRIPLAQKEPRAVVREYRDEVTEEREDGFSTRREER